jgi:2-enoate reductase
LREKEFVAALTDSPKDINVVGGGIAGMEAARRLAERGHRVELYEKEASLGGQLSLASRQPQKEGYASFVEYQIAGLKKAGVEVFFNAEITRDGLNRRKPDIAVIATGARPQVPNIPGADGAKVVQAVDVIAGKRPVGEKVLVVGGKLLGMETALQLAEIDKRVMLATRHLLGGEGPERNLYRELRNRLFARGVQVFENSPVVEIRPEGVYIAFHNELVFLEADDVVLAVGFTPNNKLLDELREAGFPVHAIGDCVEARNALLAVREGAELGNKL